MHLLFRIQRPQGAIFCLQTKSSVFGNQNMFLVPDSFPEAVMHDLAGL